MQEQYNIPLKRCIVCSNEFPATTEYFYSDNRYDPPRLRGACRTCHSETVKRTRDFEKQAEYGRQWDVNNRERRRKICNEWRYRNIEEQRERERVTKRNDPNHSSRNREWGRRNPERRRQTRREYAKKNRAKLSAICHRYWARRRGFADDFNEDDWQFALDHFNGRCAVCGRPPGFFHTMAMDHWIPLNNPDCPGTIPANIVPLCHGNEGCNNSKHDKDPHEWLSHKYGAKKAGAILDRIHNYFSQARQPS